MTGVRRGGGQIVDARAQFSTALRSTTAPARSHLRLRARGSAAGTGPCGSLQTRSHGVRVEGAHNSPLAPHAPRGGSRAQSEHAHAAIDAYSCPVGTDSRVRASRRVPRENGVEERSCRCRARSRKAVETN